MALLHHMGITVRDTTEAVAFYRAVDPDVRVTGPLVKRGAAVSATVGVEGAEIWLTFIAFAEGTAVLELAEYRGIPSEPLVPVNSKAGAAHPAVVVPDVAAALGRLAQAGYTPTADPGTATDGPMAGYRYVYVIGPDMLRVELLELPH